MVEIEPELKCWKEYAYNAGIHPAITAFLETNNKYFYDIKSTVNGKEYITARGWEDLSTEIQAYERNNFPVDEDLIMQYITNKECARKFAVYYDLFKKYRVDYAITDILAGSISEGAVNKAAKAQFDERLSIISMIMEAIGTSAKVVTTDDAAMREVVTNLRRLKKAVGSSDAIYQMLQGRIDESRTRWKRRNRQTRCQARKKPYTTPKSECTRSTKKRLMKKVYSAAAMLSSLRLLKLHSRQTLNHILHVRIKLINRWIMRLPSSQRHG